jgi:hypothetical protein
MSDGLWNTWTPHRAVWSHQIGLLNVVGAIVTSGYLTADQYSLL